MPQDASLSFLPWVRQGAAAAITTVDTLGSQQRAVADLGATLTVNDSPLPPITVRLRGPADVIGIDTNQVVRTDPRPRSKNFESNCFASIEFDAADFPWLFTPAAADASSRLRPWLCLVVVRKQEGITLSSTNDAPLPTLRIVTPAQPFVELPDLQQSWAWAHSQAAAADNSSNEVGKALDGRPELSLSRLVCPRLLDAETDYIACVVPTFELGRKAGLGLPIRDSDLTATNALAPAWTLTATAPTQVLLPVYYHWEFRTGPGGDFESLARRLRHSAPQGLGRRVIDISRPGFELPFNFRPEFTVTVEGALQPLNATTPNWWTTSVYAGVFSEALSRIVNESSGPAAPSTGDPILRPPLYGRWYAGRGYTMAGSHAWFDILNLVPPWRVAAAVGTRVIQQHQEELMASAWEQAGELQHVNQRRRQLQLSLVVGESLHARHLSRFSEEMTLRVAAPAFTRIRVPSASDPRGRTLAAKMRETSLPVPATRTAMRRIGRQRGPLTRRIAAQGYARSAVQTWIAALNRGDDFPAPPPQPGFEHARISSLPSVATVTDADWKHGFTITADGQALASIPNVNTLPGTWDYPGFFRAAAREHLARLRVPVVGRILPQQTMEQTINTVRAQMHPRASLAALAGAVVATGDNVLQPAAPGVTPLGVETVMMTPSFPQPMYEALRELSQDWLLPGLHEVKPDTVLGLKTNRMFVEAFMVGLNFEMARELLWRGFPTDQLGTYFQHFWSYDAAGSATPDIGELAAWTTTRLLGSARPGAPAAEFVLLLRSELLRRYPNALIYLTPAVNDPARTDLPPDILPIFSGSADPDVSFFGFPVSPQAAIGTGGATGYYVVIQEHPTEPRFGLDVGTAVGSASHLVIGAQPPAGLPLRGFQWGRNSAHMAGITRRLPLRIAIHARQLIGTP